MDRHSSPRHQLDRHPPEKSLTEVPWWSPKLIKMSRLEVTDMLYLTLNPSSKSQIISLIFSCRSFSKAFLILFVAFVDIFLSFHFEANIKPREF